MSETYLEELLEEKDLLDQRTFIHAIRLLDDEVMRVTAKNDARRDPSAHILEEAPEMQMGKKSKYRVYTGGIANEEIVKLSEKVVIPVKEYPKFNFVGKILGPRGNTLKRLQASTQTRMSVLGKGSTRDKDKEEELRKTGESKYEHLNDPLHVLIEVEAPRSEAHARLAAALAEIRKYMIPENDEIRQDQMREMALLNTFDQNPDAAAITLPHMMGGGGRGRQITPIIRVGIPPPGAIILNGHGQPPMAIRGRVPRVMGGGRGRPIRHILPRQAAPAPEYAYDAYEPTFEAAYEGYPESGEAVYYEYADEYPSTSSRERREKRPAGSASFSGKKFRSDPYSEVSYPSQEPTDPYRAASLR